MPFVPKAIAGFGLGILALSVSLLFFSSPKVDLSRLYFSFRFSLRQLLKHSRESSLVSQTYLQAMVL